jgi:hypothetical protein
MEAVAPIQIGMMVEPATSNPMNVVLIRRRQARDEADPCCAAAAAR